MRIYRCVDTLRVALAAALGLTPVSCRMGSRFACANPTPVVVGGTDTGYDTCKGVPSSSRPQGSEVVRRRAIVDCPNLTAKGVRAACSPRAGSGCSCDADCKEKPFGACVDGSWMSPGRFCLYGCVRDSDCASGQICVCSDPVGRCEPASCNAGTCGSRSDCADYNVDFALGEACRGRAFACQTSRDECLTDSDCKAGHICGIPPGDRSRVCSPARCSE